MQKIKLIRCGNEYDEHEVSTLLEDGWKVISVTSTDGAVSSTHSITPCFLLVLEKEK